MPLPYSLVLNQSSLKNALKLFDLFLITFVRKIGKNINGRKKQSDNKINKECNFKKKNHWLTFLTFLGIHSEVKIIQFFNTRFKIKTII